MYGHEHSGKKQNWIHFTHQSGAFNQIGETYGKLFQWAGPRGLFIPNVSKTATVIHRIWTSMEHHVSLVCWKRVSTRGWVYVWNVPQRLQNASGAETYCGYMHPGKTLVIFNQSVFFLQFQCKGRFYFCLCINLNRRSNFTCIGVVCSNRRTSCWH